MAGEFKAWLQKQGLSAEDQKKVEDAFNIEGLSAKLDNGVMSQDRFSRSMDDLRAEQARLAAKEADLQSKWETANAEYQVMQETVGVTARQLADKEAEVARLRGDLDKSKIDPSKVVTPEYLERVRREDAAGIGNVMKEFMVIQMEHKQVFGQELPIGEFYDAAMAANDGKSLRQQWETKYNVPAKREEIAKKAAEEHDNAIRAEERKKVLGEVSNPASRSLKPSQNPFYTPEGKVKDGDTERPATGPWDDTGTPPAEAQLLQELEAARYGT